VEQITFTDSEGAVWNVREDTDDIRPSSSDVAPGTSWLRFENDSEVRRLWHYPDDWRGLTPVQLESLLERASTVIARFRPAVQRAADRDAEVGRTHPSADSLAADRPIPGTPAPGASANDKD
jgi:hypothetical protein